MKAGYKILESLGFGSNDECILLFNWQEINEVAMYSLPLKSAKEMKNEHCVGKWSIKHLK